MFSHEHQAKVSQKLYGRIQVQEQAGPELAVQTMLFWLCQILAGPITYGNFTCKPATNLN
jgi:hypothetical protein